MTTGLLPFGFGVGNRLNEYKPSAATAQRICRTSLARPPVGLQITVPRFSPSTPRWGIINRFADNWRPLFAIAEIAGDKWPKHVRTIAHSAEAGKEDPSVRTMLLSDIRDIFAARPESDRISSTELASTLGQMEGRPWTEWRNGKPMTAAAMARMLSPFGILPGTRRAGSETFKGYLYSAFEEAFSSYLCADTVAPSQLNNDGHCDASITTGIVTLCKPSQGIRM